MTRAMPYRRRRVHGDQRALSKQRPQVLDRLLSQRPTKLSHSLLRHRNRGRGTRDARASEQRHNNRCQRATRHGCRFVPAGFSVPDIFLKHEISIDDSKRVSEQQQQHRNIYRSPAVGLLLESENRAIFTQDTGAHRVSDTDWHIVRLTC